MSTLVSYWVAIHWYISPGCCYGVITLNHYHDIMVFACHGVIILNHYHDTMVIVMGDCLEAYSYTGKLLWVVVMSHCYGMIWYDMMGYDVI